MSGNGEKLKILQVHNYYQIPGGEDTVVANEKKLLEDYGHEVIQYSRNSNELKSLSRFRKLLLPFTTIFNPRTYTEVKRIIREREIDIVHVHNTLNLISPAVYYAALKCIVPVVQTIHNFRLLCPGATFYRDGHICEDCVEKGLGCAIKYNCYRGSKAQTLVCVVSTWIHRLTGIYGKLNYICLTEFNKEKLLNLKQIKPEKVFVKPNFAANQPNTVVPLQERKNQIIFAGRIDKLKGVDILLEAWKSMGENALRLLICGTGPLDEWCKDYIQKNKLTNVEMLGFVPNEEAKKLIANSRALILPTQWYEGFPMTIVEAYSVGTPVIGPNMGNVGSLIENEKSGWTYEDNSIKSLVNILEKARDSRDTQKITEQTVLEVAEKYSRKRNEMILIDIYRRLLT